MIKIIDYLIDKLNNLRNRLDRNNFVSIPIKEDTPHNEWLKGYWKWRKQNK